MKFKHMFVGQEVYLVKSGAYATIAEIQESGFVISEPAGDSLLDQSDAKFLEPKIIAGTRVKIRKRAYKPDGSLYGFRKFSDPRTGVALYADGTRNIRVEFDDGDSWFVGVDEVIVLAEAS